MHINVHPLIMKMRSSEKKADISRRHYCFSSEMTSEKREQKFHTDVVLSSASDWS